MTKAHNIENFVHLRVLSHYSLGKSLITPKTLIEACLKQNISTIALTDIGNMSGAIDFAYGCESKDIKPIIGCIFYIDDIELTLLAKNKKGYENLIQLSTTVQNRSITINDLKQFAEGLFCILSSIVLDFPFWLKEIFKESFAAGIYSSMNKPYIKMLQLSDIMVVALAKVHYIDKKDSDSYDIFYCMHEKISKVTLQDDNSNKHLKTLEEIKIAFKDYPEAIVNTQIIADLCRYYPKPSKPMLPKVDNEIEAIKQQSLLGLTNYNKHNDSNYIERLNYELDVIIKMQFCGYFLIVADFINWAKANNTPVGPGRGSGAGSIVAWCLGITEIDPIKYGLLFERFLNPDRVSLPDFDVDFCQERRTEVIQYVTEKYGANRVAHICTFGTVCAKYAIKDVGKALNIPFEKLDEISKLIPSSVAQTITLQEAIKQNDVIQKLMNECHPQFLNFCLKVEGLNRSRGTHAAGIVISNIDIDKIIGCYSSESGTAIQYSMKSAELAGLIKFDFLGLKTLTITEDIKRLVKIHEPDKAYMLKYIDDVDNKEYNTKVFNVMSGGFTAAIFQFESSGIKKFVQALKPDCLEDLIALTSLYRPGPMQFISLYIQNKQSQKYEVKYKSIDNILRQTYGILIYQEQVMEIAKQYANYTLAEADLMRRAMGKKNQKEMEQQKELFISRSSNEKDAKAIFDMIDTFANYGFNKSHAAAYATISYRTAFLKTWFLPLFYIANLNAALSNVETINLIHYECKKNKKPIKICAPCILKSKALFSLCEETKRDIIFGLAGIKGLSLEIAKYIEANGPYENFEDFLYKNNKVNKKNIVGLIKAGAFNCWNMQKTFEEQYGVKYTEQTEFEVLGIYIEKHGVELIDNDILTTAIGKPDQDLSDVQYLTIKEFEELTNDQRNHKTFILCGCITQLKISSKSGKKLVVVTFSDKDAAMTLFINNEELFKENYLILKVKNIVRFRVDITNGYMNVTEIRATKIFN